MTNNKDSRFIKISSVKASGNKLEVKLEFSKDVGKYFFKNHFQVYYDKNIEGVDESILSIPAVCVTIQIAWATGADLYVEKLDETFLGCLPKIRKVFEEFYPKFSSSGNIHVKEQIVNKFNNKQTALLYTGGLDSTVSYIRNKEKKPILITLLKPSNSNYLKIKKSLKKFASEEGIEIRFIESNVWDISDTTNNFLLGQEFETKDWWGHVSHGLIICGLSAPLTTERIRKVLLASSVFEKESIPHGSHFLLWTDFSWADIHTFYDGADLTRQEKIRNVLKANQPYQKNLLVCFCPLEGPNLKNCGNCEKCLRTITGLIMEGIEPNDCNFEVRNTVFEKIKILLKSCQSLFDIEDWLDIQKQIPDRINDDKISRNYHAKEFFEWLKDFKLFGNYKPPNFFMKLKYLYYTLKFDGFEYPRQEIRLFILKRILKNK